MSAEFLIASVLSTGVIAYEDITTVHTALRVFCRYIFATSMRYLQNNLICLELALYIAYQSLLSYGGLIGNDYQSVDMLSERG